MTIKIIVELFILLVIVYLVGVEVGPGTAAAFTMVILGIMQLSHKIDQYEKHRIDQYEKLYIGSKPTVQDSSPRFYEGVVTGKNAAEAASDVLRSKSSSKAAKSAAGSALSQRK